MLNQYLLDTSVLIAHYYKSNPQANRILSEIIQKQKIGLVSALTYYEIWKGAIDESHERDCKIIFRSLKILTLTKDIAGYAAQFYLSLPKNERCDKLNIDLLIAATAEFHRIPLVTMNIKDFKRFPLTVSVTYL